MLSSQDIEEYLNHQIKIIKYPQLKKYKTIDELLRPYNQVIILYETKKNIGHWVLLYLHKGILNFFDSYGFMYPNDELHLIDERFKKINDMSPIYLFNLLFQKYDVDQNAVQYQRFGKNINTCGYWCIARIYLKNLSNDYFKKIFYNKDDNFVVRFVNVFHNEIL